MAGAGMKTAAERKRDERRRMRAAGFVLRQLWVHPLDWPAVRAYVERKRKERPPTMPRTRRGAGQGAR